MIFATIQSGIACTIPNTNKYLAKYIAYIYILLPQPK